LFSVTNTDKKQISFSPENNTGAFFLLHHLFTTCQSFLFNHTQKRSCYILQGQAFFTFQ